MGSLKEYEGVEESQLVDALSRSERSVCCVVPRPAMECSVNMI
jgi:hypothetical protein